MTPILSLTLAPPRMATNGRSGILQRLPEILQLFLHQQPGRGLLHELGDAHGGGVRTMRRAERVIDVEVRELRQLLGEVLVVRFFLGVEAQVLQQQRLAFFELQRHLFGLRPDALGAEADIFSAGQFAVEQTCAAARRPA